MSQTGTLRTIRRSNQHTDKPNRTVVRLGLRGALFLTLSMTVSGAHATVIEFGDDGARAVTERLNPEQRARLAGRQTNRLNDERPNLSAAPSPASSAEKPAFETIETLPGTNIPASAVTVINASYNEAPLASVVADLNPKHSVTEANQNPASVAKVRPTSNRSNPPTSAPLPVPRLHGLAMRAASDAGVPRDVFLALITEESAWRVEAISSKGALGLAQLMPMTAVELGVDPLIPAENLSGGARYLAQAYNRFGTWALALAAYNAGPRRVADLGGAVPDFPETRGYVARVLTRAARLSTRHTSFSTPSSKEH